MSNFFATSSVCCTCGCPLSPNTTKRTKNVQQISGLLSRIWQRTPFVWAYLDAYCKTVDPHFSLSMCMACMHWTIRSIINYRKTKKRVYLPMDCVLMYCLCPTGPRPDARVLSRCCKSLFTELQTDNELHTNPYKYMIFNWVYAIFESMSHKNVSYQDTIQKIARAWWVLQGRPVVLPSAQLAAIIRQTT